ncbi:MAG: hypothetical protein OEZ01_06510, partial [Candidatus Heimdallarchaeota archaeon]|nr:hypothetical protein [Candidatus Heimdallarchaeota archaeon]
MTINKELEKIAEKRGVDDIMKGTKLPQVGSSIKNNELSVDSLALIGYIDSKTVKNIRKTTNINNGLKIVPETASHLLLLGTKNENSQILDEGYTKTKK